MSWPVARHGRALILPALLTSLALAACQKGPDAAVAQGRPAAMARGVVAVDGGLVPITAPRDGVIARVDAEEGAHVARGAVLAQLDEDRAGLQADQAAAETAQAAAAWRGAQARLAAAQAEAGRLARLASIDAASGHEAEQARQAALIAAAQSEEAGRAVDVARARQGLADLERRARSVRAPVAGLVLRRAAAVGSMTAAGVGPPLFVLAPDRPRIVQAELDEAFVGRVAPGATAWVTDAGGDGAAYRARVLRVSSAFDTATLDDPQGGRADGRVLRLALAFEAPNGLRLGQRVLVKIP